VEVIIPPFDVRRYIVCNIHGLEIYILYIVLIMILYSVWRWLL